MRVMINNVVNKLRSECIEWIRHIKIFRKESTSCVTRSSLFITQLLPSVTCDVWPPLAFERPCRRHLRLLLIQAIQAHVHLLVARPLQSNLLSHLRSAKWTSIIFPKTASNTRDSVTIIAFCWEVLKTIQSSSSFWIYNSPPNRFLTYPREQCNLLLNWPIRWPNL